MNLLQMLAWVAGVLFFCVSVGALGMIALFALADRAADRESRNKRPPRQTD